MPGSNLKAQAAAAAAGPLFLSAFIELRRVFGRVCEAIEGAFERRKLRCSGRMKEAKFLS